MSKTQNETVVVSHGHHEFDIVLPFNAVVFKVEISPNDNNTVSVQHDKGSNTGKVKMDIGSVHAHFTYFASDEETSEAPQDKAESDVEPQFQEDKTESANDPDPVELVETVGDSVLNDADDVHSGVDNTLSQQGIPNPLPENN